uniref:Uncharacterized protein n=1 Tax=Arundo donax TaxID=35708 RepID=A0A0A8ZW54_ARUDO
MAEDIVILQGLYMKWNSVTLRDVERIWVTSSCLLFFSWA